MHQHPLAVLATWRPGNRIAVRTYDLWYRLPKPTTNRRQPPKTPPPSTSYHPRRSAPTNAPPDATTATGPASTANTNLPLTPTTLVTTTSIAGVARTCNQTLSWNRLTCCHRHHHRGYHQLRLRRRREPLLIRRDPCQTTISSWTSSWCRDTTTGTSPGLRYYHSMAVTTAARAPPPASWGVTIRSISPERQGNRQLTSTLDHASPPPVQPAFRQTLAPPTGSSLARGDKGYIVGTPIPRQPGLEKKPLLVPGILPNAHQA